MSDVNPPQSVLGSLITKFQSSSWIWITEPSPPNAPPGDVAFRKTYTSPSGKTASKATVLTSVDDRFSFYVNGNLVGSSPDTTDIWKNAQVFSTSLSGTSNVFAFRATNLADPNVGGDSPAGLIAAIQITFADGSTEIIVSDTTWKTTSSIPSNFQSPSLSDASWSNAVALAPYGQGPWGTSVTFPQPGPSSSSSSATPKPTPTPTSSTSSTGASTPDAGTMTFSGGTLSASGSTPSTDSTSSTPTTLPSSTQTSSSKSAQLGPIIGGTLGGVGVCLLGILLGLLIYRGRKTSTKRSLSDALAAPPTSSANPSEIFPLASNSSRGNLAVSPYIMTEHYHDDPPPAWSAGYPATPYRSQYQSHGGYYA